MEYEFLSILKCALHQMPYTKILPPEQWRAILKLANEQNVLPCVACSIPSAVLRQLPNEIAATVRNAIHLNIAKNDNQLFAAQEIQSTLEQNQIAHVAFKGINTKKRYPNPLYRAMGDIDILFHPNQQKQVKETMLRLGFDDYHEGRKHDYYNRRPFVSVEMHRVIFDTSSEFSTYYDDIWGRCRLKNGCKYTYEMSPSDEMILNFLHLTDDFKRGLVAARYVMDVYVYSHCENVDTAYVRSEFQKLGVLQFYENIQALAEYWFGDGAAESDKQPLIDQLSAFILTSGSEGRYKREASLKAAQNGRFHTLLQACFPNLQQMQSMFPWLQTAKILLPAAWLLRICRSLHKRKANVHEQFTAFQAADVHYGRELLQFQTKCGL